MKIEIELPAEYNGLDKGGKHLDIHVSEEAIWRYKAHDIAVKAAQRVFETEYAHLMSDDEALIEFAKSLEWTEVDDAPERQSLVLEGKSVEMKELYKTAKISVN